MTEAPDAYVGESPSSWQADLELVRNALRQDATASASLADRLQCVPRILAARNRRMGRPLDEHDLADVVQSTLLIILRKLPTFEGRSSIEGWVYRICSFELLNNVRGKRRRPMPVDGFEESLPARPDAENDDPWEYEELYWALDRIHAEDAEVIRLKHLEDLTFLEIAERLDCPASTAKARYYRGIDALSGMLDPAGDRRDGRGPGAATERDPE